MGESSVLCESLDRLWIISSFRLETSQHCLSLDPTCLKYEWEWGVPSTSQEWAVSYMSKAGI